MKYFCCVCCIILNSTIIYFLPHFPLMLCDKEISSPVYSVLFRIHFHISAVALYICLNKVRYIFFFCLKQWVYNIYGMCLAIKVRICMLYHRSRYCALLYQEHYAKLYYFSLGWLGLTQFGSNRL